MYKIQLDHKTKFRITDSTVTDSGVVIPCITGQVGQVGVQSPNGYAYQRHFWKDVMNRKQVQDCINSRNMICTIEHPVDDSKFLKTPYTEASHIVLKGWVTDDGNPWATFGLLNNQYGNAIKALVDVGHHPGVSTRGMGQFTNDPELGQVVDTKDYMLIGFDLVTNPNFSNLSMAPVTDSMMQNPLFRELCDSYQLRDDAYKGYNRDALISDMGKMINELQAKYKLLAQC